MFVCWPKNTGSSLNPLSPLSQGETGRERSCLLHLSSKSVLIKLYKSAGPRKCTHHYTENVRVVFFLSTIQGFSSVLSPSELASLSVCLSWHYPLFLPPCPFWWATGCVFQPVFECGAINAGQWERVECEEWGGAPQLLIDSVFKVWKTGDGSFVRGEQTGREERRGWMMWFVVQHHFKTLIFIDVIAFTCSCTWTVGCV